MFEKSSRFILRFESKYAGYYSQLQNRLGMGRLFPSCIDINNDALSAKMTVKDEKYLEFGGERFTQERFPRQNIRLCVAADIVL